MIYMENAKQDEPDDEDELKFINMNEGIPDEDDEDWDDEDNGMVSGYLSTYPSAVFQGDDYDEYLFNMIYMLTEAAKKHEPLVISEGLGVRYMLDFLEETARMKHVYPYDDDELPDELHADN